MIDDSEISTGPENTLTEYSWPSDDGLFATRPGPGDNYGDLPASTAPTDVGPGFAPEHLCLVYIRFDEGRLIFRHLYMDLPQPVPSDSQIVRLSTPILEDIRVDSVRLWPSLKRYTKSTDRFGFSSQHIVLIFLDNHETLVRFNIDPLLKYIISFTKISGQSATRIIQPNTNFYNLRPAPDILSPSLKGKKVFLMDFWNRDAQGNSLSTDPKDPTTYYWQSMNIHIQMATEAYISIPPDPIAPPAAPVWVPLIVDPDTGNMGTDP